MTSRRLTPKHPRARGAVTTIADPLCRPTPILDWRHPAVRDLASRLGSAPEDPRGYLLRAHAEIATSLRPVYGVRERQPVSRTLARGRGSCSQRLAVLEAVARAGGIPTRVEGLLVDGRFWHARAGRARHLVPDQVVLAWPEFRFGEQWVSVSELHGGLEELAAGAGDRGFSNAEAETLFEAVGRTAVDWHGRVCDRAPGCDLSGAVRCSLGHFPSRDALFALHGETICAPVRPLADAVLSRWSAQAA